jgi:hypothetical protein
LGGVPFFADDWGVDAMYSGSQKALSAPPGSAPLMLGPRAFEKLSSRKTKVASYQNDLSLIGDYWGWYDKRFYHHTGMVSMTYALREALEVVKVCSFCHSSCWLHMFECNAVHVLTSTRYCWADWSHSDALLAFLVPYRYGTISWEARPYEQ